MYRHSLSLLFAALLPVLFVLSACDSGGESDVNNEFSLSITPVSSSSAGGSLAAAEQKDLSGFSFFVDQEDPETGEQVFGIYMSDDESFSEQNATQGLFGFVARETPRPGSGTYSFGGGGTLQSSDFAGVLYEKFGSGQQGDPVYVVLDGTLTLDESSADKVAGSIDTRAVEIVVSGTAVQRDTVRIEGSFTAKDVNTVVPFTSPAV
jgi:hypothetical protein